MVDVCQVEAENEVAAKELVASFRHKTMGEASRMGLVACDWVTLREATPDEWTVEETTLSPRALPDDSDDCIPF
jgi:hypothetical protein